MARLIEIRSLEATPVEIAVAPGDLLLFYATGAVIRAGHEYVRVLGPFVPGTVLASGEIIAPAGAPGSLAILAERRGRADVSLVAGDPRHAPALRDVAILVTD